MGMDKQVPRSPYDRVGGLVYFGRLIDKIRLHQAGQLREDLVPNLGIAFDAICCEFLRVDYQELAAKTAGGDSDEALLEWCFQRGWKPDERCSWLWNQAMSKRGWNDDLTPKLQQRLKEGGFADRTDARTMFDYIDLDEGRNLQGNQT